jgi:hypothetical protein
MARTTLWNFIVAVIVIAVLAGGAVAALSGARAEAPPAFDRALVERLVRAQEAQARALEKLVSATDRCKR